MTSDDAAERVDLVVVGAGPAGMAAASTALAGGLRVALLDAGASLGGQYWRHPAPGALPDGGYLHHDLATYTALRRHLAAHEGRLLLLLQHQAWTAVATGEGFAVHAIDRSGPVGGERAVVVSGDRLLIATGAFDRQIPFPGWDLPGVFTAGGLQALLKGNGVRAGSRVVIAGTGPFLLPVATALAASGARIVALCEANSPRRWLPHAGTAVRLPSKALEGADYARQLARHRIPVHTSSAVVAAHGTGSQAGQSERLHAVTIARLDGRGNVRPGTQRRVAADTLGVGWGFVPQLDLAVTLGCRLRAGDDENEVVSVDGGQRSSVDGVYVAGEATGVGGAALALAEGQLAAEAVLADAGRTPATPASRLRVVRRRVRDHRAFARAMHLAHPVPRDWSTWLADDTLLCRCEEVPVSAVRDAVAAGAADARQVKQLTRAGMGWCQGRMCAYAAACLSGGDDLARPAPTPSEASAEAGHSLGGDARAAPAYPAVERLVATPVPLGALATEAPSVPSAM